MEVQTSVVVQSSCCLRYAVTLLLVAATVVLAQLREQWASVDRAETEFCKGCQTGEESGENLTLGVSNSVRACRLELEARVRIDRFFASSAILIHSLTMTQYAQEFSSALGRTIKYINVPPQIWEAKLQEAHLPPHLIAHLNNMGRLHRDNRYDRMTDSFQQLVGRAPISAVEFARRHADVFTPQSERSNITTGGMRI